MNSEEQKAFLKFLVETKKVLPNSAIQTCLSVQQALKGLGIEKTIDKVIVEKGFLDAKQTTNLLREFKGGDEELIPGYRITKKLGEGAMGEVYSAIDLHNDNRTVAIKILFPHLGKRKATAQRFLQEARLCIVKLDHPNIVKGYDVGYEATHDFFFYVMEFVDGSNLRSILKEHGVLSEPLAIKIMTQIGSALQQAASHNLVHRDIKPDNIMLTKNGDAKLCDLGLARDWTKDDLGLTKTGAVMGTPFYISPEAAEGKKLDARSDIYSLGATIYHIVVGAVPFDGPNTAVVLNRHRNDPLIPPKELRNQLTAGFSAIIEMMLAKSPSDRYQTPDHLLDDLRRLQNGYAPHALIKIKDSYGATEVVRKPKTQIMAEVSTSDPSLSPIEQSESAASSPEPTPIPTNAIHSYPKSSHTTTPIASTNVPPSLEPPPFQDSVEISKFVENTTSKIKRRQDMVEEYLIEDPSPNFDSVILVDHRKRHKQQNMFPAFLNSSEQNVSKTGSNDKSRLLFFGALIGGVGLIVIIFIIFIIMKMLK